MIDGKRCILVCDDEVKMVRAVKDFLNTQDFHILTAFDGQQALELHDKYHPKIDLMLLDVMMPQYSGFEVLESIRLNNSLVPVIMFTARSEEYDQLQGFHLGADDYITKPFSPSLLLARVESVLRRTGKLTTSELTLEGITLNVENRTCLCLDYNVDLKNREFDLLYFLMVNHGQVFTREQLLSSVWGYDFEGDSRTVDTHIKQLRIKLKENSSYITTIHRIGYKFNV